MASPRAVDKFERMFQCDDDPDQGTINMLAASERCTPFAVKQWFADRRQERGGTGELSAIEQVQRAQPARMERLAGPAQPDSGLAARKPQPEPQFVAWLDLEPEQELVLVHQRQPVSPGPLSPDTPTARQLHKLEQRRQLAEQHTAVVNDAAVQLLSPRAADAPPPSGPGPRTSSAPATLETPVTDPKALAAQAVEQLNLSAFWALHESDHRAHVNLTTVMHQTAPVLAECSVAAFGQQVKREPQTNQAARRVAMLQDIPDVATVRSRLSSLVALLDQSMHHINQATFAEFEADFGARPATLETPGRVTWGESVPEKDVLSPSHRALSLQEANRQWEHDQAAAEGKPSLDSTGEDEVAGGAPSREIAVMSADELLGRLQLSTVSRAHVKAAPVVLLPQKPPLLLVRCMPASGPPPPRLLTAVSADLKYPAPKPSRAEAAENEAALEIVGGYKAGDDCEVFSRSGQVWCSGVVKAVRVTNGTLHVEYMPPGAGPGGEMSKMVKVDATSQVRKPDRVNGAADAAEAKDGKKMKEEDDGLKIEWSPRSEYLLGEMGEVVLYDSTGVGLREACAGTPRIVALAQTLLDTGAAAKVWVLGGGSEAVLRRCPVMQASAFTRRCVDYSSSSSPSANDTPGLGRGAGKRNRPEDPSYTDWMMSYRCSVEEIEPGFMFLGNIKARDEGLLKGLGIRYVLNAANGDLDEMAPLPAGDFECFTLNLLDGTQLSAADGRLRNGLAFIDKAKRNGGKVLVHCALGANRSTTLLLSWLLTRTTTTLAAAFRRTWRARPCVAPWPQNARFLRELEATWPLHQARQRLAFATGTLTATTLPQQIVGGLPQGLMPHARARVEPDDCTASPVNPRAPQSLLAGTASSDEDSATAAATGAAGWNGEPSLWLWQLDPEMLKEADELEWLARKIQVGLPVPPEPDDVHVVEPTRVRSV